MNSPQVCDDLIRFLKTGDDSVCLGA